MPIEIINDKDIELVVEIAEVTKSNFGLFGQPIYRSQYMDGVREFNERFSYNNGYNKGKRNYFAFQDIENLIDSSGYSETEAMVVFYHGFKNGGLEHGIRIIKGSPPIDNERILTPFVDSLAGEFPTHRLLNNKFVKIPDHLISDWQWSIGDYYSGMKVKRFNLQIEQVKDTEDPKAVIFPWMEEIKKLYTDNAAQIGIYQYRYAISDFAVPRRRNIGSPGEYRHGLSLHIQRKTPEMENWEDLLGENVDNTVLVFHNLGLDYGNLCPHRCKKFML